MVMIRAELEQREKMMLSPFAAKAAESAGRAIKEEDDPLRTCYMRDRDRIIHSKAFRRLKHKTQVYISPGNDHYRTRLTHTLEVCQIAKTIGRCLNLNEDLIEAIALAHDVGHTPFAHTGEEVLNNLSSKGFKHNINSVRVLTKIEQRSGGREGLNLTAEVLEGVLKHSGYGEGKPCAVTLEGQIIRYSDKIAYVQHDIDDSIRAGILSEDILPKEYTDVLGHSHSGRITTLVTDLVNESRKLMQSAQTEDKLVLKFSPDIENALQGLRKFMFANVYKGSVFFEERKRATIILEFLFGYFSDHPEAMPDFYRKIANEEGIEQGVVDYISGMTDNYCVDVFQQLTIPKAFLQRDYTFSGE